MLRFLSSLILLAALTRPVIAADSCPEPIAQVTTDLKGQLDGTVSALLKLGQLKVTGDVDTFTKDVLHDYPNADKLALQQNALSILCNKILPSRDYSQEVKDKIIQKLLDILGDILPNPTKNILGVFPIGKTSIDYVIYVLGRPRQDLNGVAEFPKDGLVLIFRYALKAMASVPKGNIYEIDVFSDNSSENIPSIPVGSSNVSVSKTYIKDIFQEQTPSSRCRIKRAMGMYRTYYLDCVATRYFLAGVKDHEDDVDNLIWMAENLSNCMPANPLFTTYLKQYNDFFKRYNLIKRYQFSPPDDDHEYDNCGSIAETLQYHIGSTQIDYAINWNFIIYGVAMLGVDDGISFIPEDRIAAAEYVSN